jgi:hypothetical protein
MFSVCGSYLFSPSAPVEALLRNLNKNDNVLVADAISHPQHVLYNRCVVPTILLTTFLRSIHALFF